MASVETFDCSVKVYVIEWLTYIFGYVIRVTCSNLTDEILVRREFWQLAIFEYITNINFNPSIMSLQRYVYAGM